MHPPKGHKSDRFAPGAHVETPVTERIFDCRPGKATAKVVSMIAVQTWREEDEALLRRLEDEIVIERLWSRQAPPQSTPLPTRASGLIRELRGIDGGSEAAERASAGEIEALFPLLLVENLASRPAPLVHQLAVYFDRLAGAYEGRMDRDPSRATAMREEFVRAKVRSLAAYIALRDEKSYLQSLARRVVDGALRGPEIDAAVAAIAQSHLEGLGAIARAGARDLTWPAHAALAVLARVEEACRIAGCDARTTTMTSRRAESIRATAIDDALAPVLDGIASSKLRDDGERLAPALFDKVRVIWEWSGYDEAVERFAVDEVTTLAWSIYRESRWDPLRALLAPCMPLYDSLAVRIEREPKRHVAYAAKAAQMFVFRSECETDRVREWSLAERALVLCPSHRNGRLVMAHLLCDQAVRVLGTSLFPGRAAVENAKQSIARAEELFPQSKRLPDARAKLEEVMARAGGRLA